MAEAFVIPESKSKKERYAAILPQLRALVEGEVDSIANQANVVAALKAGMDFFWIGIYRVEGKELVLGPFQGPVACTRIGFGKGVCGSAWKQQKTLIVPDVDAFPGHIACSSEARSEIVVPVMREGKVIAVLDVDSVQRDAFDGADRAGLESVAELLASLTR